MQYFSVDLLVNKNGLCIVFAVSLSFHIYIFLDIYKILLLVL